MPGTAQILPDRLPPPPIAPRSRRLARGSLPPVAAELAIDVRTIAPPTVWTRVVPVSPRTGVPLLARDRRPSSPQLPLADRAAPVLVATLAAVTAVLGTLLAL